MAEQARLPEVIPPNPSNHLPAAPYYPPVVAPPEIEVTAPSVPMSHYVWILRRHLWKMLAFVATCSLVAFIVSARIQPIYQSTATIDIDLAAPTGIVGQGAVNSASYEDPDIFFATQIRLIQSDAVLRPVAEQFHLIGGEPKPNNPNSPIDQSLANTPVSLGGLSVSRPANTYLLFVSYRSHDPRQAADIANAIANSYLARTYDLRIRSSAGVSSFMERQLDELQAKMERSSQALAQFEKELDVVNPEEKTNILSSRLLQLNGDYTTAQAERIKEESDWNAMKSGSLDAAEISAQGGNLAKLQDTLDTEELHMASVKATYGIRHPEYQKAASQVAETQRQFNEERTTVADKIELLYREAASREQMLQQAVTETKAEWDTINARSFEYQQLKQQADADKALYNELTTKIEEAGINAGFKDNDIRLADQARPSQGPIYPNRSHNLWMAFMLSSILAIAAVIVLDALDTTLRDPEEASRFLAIDVIGALPLDRGLAQLPDISESESGDPAQAGESLAVGKGGDKKKGGYYRSISGFEEAVRTIRNTILLSDFEQRLRSIVLTSATPGEGKTTLAVYLAIANAARGKKTLLVDGDLRRPSIHARFGLSPREGLSNILTGDQAWRDVVIQVKDRPHLYLLPSGPGSHRAADLIGPRLAELLDEFAKEFDLVILDSPPLLGFAECLQMANAADGVLIVSRAGETKRKAVASVVSALQRLRCNIIGVVLNHVTQSTSEGGYSYYGQDRYHYYGERK